MTLLLTFNNHNQIWIIILIPFFVGLLILFLNMLIAPSRPDVEKLSSYECGFLPFGNARMHFHVHYYLVAIFFIVFDLEIVFLIPWAYTFLFLNFISNLFAFLFLSFLGLGFFYEWKVGALNW